MASYDDNPANRRQRSEGMWVNPLVGVVDRSVRRVFDSLRGTGWVEVADGDSRFSLTPTVNTSAGNFGPFRYRKDPWGLVTVEAGLLNLGSSPGTTQVFFDALPEGFRPRYRHRQPNGWLYASGTGLGSAVVCTVEVEQDGRVVIRWAGGITADRFSFRVMFDAIQ